MGLPIRTLPVPTIQTSVPVGQLVVAGLVMPLAFAVVNQYSLNFQFDHPPDGPGTALLWLLFVSQICVISVVGARLVQKSWHGWAVYVWCWLLVDLQVLWASSYAVINGVQTESLLLTALLSAQLGLVVIWSILGEQQWTVRLPMLVDQVGDGRRKHAVLQRDFPLLLHHNREAQSQAGGLGARGVRIASADHQDLQVGPLAM